MWERCRGIPSDVPQLSWLIWYNISLWLPRGTWLLGMNFLLQISYRTYLSVCNVLLHRPYHRALLQAYVRRTSPQLNRVGEEGIAPVIAGRPGLPWTLDLFPFLGQ